MVVSDVFCRNWKLLAAYVSCTVQLAVSAATSSSFLYRTLTIMFIDVRLIKGTLSALPLKHVCSLLALCRFLMGAQLATVKAGSPDATTCQLAPQRCGSRGVTSTKWHVASAVFAFFSVSCFRGALYARLEQRTEPLGG